MANSKRVQKEVAECNKGTDTFGVKITPHGDDLSHLTGTITGPESTPYEGGTFEIDIKFSEGYPRTPLEMRFVTKVWHPNISSQTGAICLDILKEKWNPAITLKTALISLQGLLSAPAPNSPQDAVVAAQYLENHRDFVGTARNWTETFAMRSLIGMEEKVQRLVEMGFPEDLVKATLEEVGGDENRALEKL